MDVGEDMGAIIGLDPGSIEPAGLVMPHYMAAYIHLPYFDRLWFSYRILVVTFLGLSLGIGILWIACRAMAATRIGTDRYGIGGGHLDGAGAKSGISAASS